MGCSVYQCKQRVAAFRTLDGGVAPAVEEEAMALGSVGQV
jgi:hypothetical protein